MLTKIALAIVALGGIGLAAAATPAAAQSSCATPGTVALTGIPAVRQETHPSMAREIAGYGRSIIAGGCTVELVCISADGSDAANDYARKQCVVVRDLLVRAGVVKDDIKTSRKNPSSSHTAGTVYLTAL